MAPPISVWGCGVGHGIRCHVGQVSAAGDGPLTPGSLVVPDRYFSTVFERSVAGLWILRGAAGPARRLEVRDSAGPLSLPLMGRVIALGTVGPGRQAGGLELALGTGR